MMSTYSQLLTKAYREGREQELIWAADVVVSSAARMTDLLGDILAYTQLNTPEEEAGERSDLNVVVGKAIENLRTVIQHGGGRVTFDNLPTVQGLESHYIQLFQNLIENAIKYRGESSPTVHVSADRKGAEWRLAVADNGMGIDGAYHEQIFGVFKRLHGSQIPGTGIGLAICQRVVERHGGRIWVESEVNQGSTFYFTLPVLEEEATQ